MTVDAQRLRNDLRRVLAMGTHKLTPEQLHIVADFCEGKTSYWRFACRFFVRETRERIVLAYRFIRGY
jgi:hypothetical protein